jgi:hypothetical protein
MKQYLDLMLFFEGYVRNYRKLNLQQLHNNSMFTKREIEYFAQLGEFLGFHVFIEDYKFDLSKGRSRPMDLSWWKWDERLDLEAFAYLALHLERENYWDKDMDTIDKLFSKTEEGYIPHNVIAIQNVETEARIKELNKIVKNRNKKQNSNVLMIYRFWDKNNQIEQVCGYLFSEDGKMEERKAFCLQDNFGYWFMCFEEEYNSVKNNIACP